MEQGRLIEINQEILKLAQNLLKTPIVDASSASFPKQRGFYLWRSIEDEKIVYIVVGNGQNGLYGRIRSQHLASSYSKSVFRIKVAKEFRIDVRQECVDFICMNFKVAFLSYPEKHVNDAVEKILIAAFRPTYNA